MMAFGGIESGRYGWHTDDAELIVVSIFLEKTKQSCEAVAARNKAILTKFSSLFFSTI